MPIKFTGRASADLEEIYHYTAGEFNVQQAENYLAALRHMLTLLEENSGLARIYYDYVPPVRIHPWQSHFIVYVTQDDGILILRLLHQSSDLTRHLQPLH